MTSPPQTPPVATQQGALSVPQMLRLMQVEVDRAIEHGFPVSSLMAQLDGFEDEEHIPLIAGIVQAIFRELKYSTDHEGVRGMGLTRGRTIFAVFPHVTPAQIASLADMLVERVRLLQHPDESVDEDITVSVGVGHNLHKGSSSFATMVEEVETSVSLSKSAGGDRWSQWKEVEDELAALKEEIESQVREFGDEHESWSDDHTGTEAKWGAELVEKALDVFAAEPHQSEAVLRLESQIIALVRNEFQRWRQSSDFEAMQKREKQIEMLERRVTKLTKNLGVTEAELKRVAAMKEIDTGVASIYQTVQGLSGDDDNAETKAEMLKSIFDANLELRT